MRGCEIVHHGSREGVGECEPRHTVDGPIGDATDAPFDRAHVPLHAAVLCNGHAVITQAQGDGWAIVETAGYCDLLDGHDHSPCAFAIAARAALACRCTTPGLNAAN